MALEEKFIKNIKEGERIRWFYNVKAKRLKSTKQGAYYLDIVLNDKSGEVSAKVWDDVEKNSSLFNEGDIVYVDAQVEIYNNKKQLRISQIRKAHESEINPEDILPSSKIPPDTMFKELVTIYEKNVSNGFIKELLKRIFDKYGEKFKRWPGAVKVHHSYFGGLLEHTLSVTKHCVHFAEKYNLSKDIMIAGAILHDIGKIEEIGIDKGFYLTEKGLLMGHIGIGVSMVEKEVSKIIGFPENIKTKLIHMILSHHGTLENGSPVLPSMKESFSLFIADYLDSQMNIFEDINKRHEGESSISDFDNRLSRKILIDDSND